MRTGQTAKYLSALGHDVRVVTAARQASEGTDLVLEVPRDHVVYTPWLGSGIARAVSSREPASEDGGSAKDGAESARSAVAPPVKRLLRLAQRDLIYMPDDCVGWYPWAVAACFRLIRRHPADLIYASAGPLTSLLVASTVARLCGVPWVGELRDRWSDNHYRELAPWFHRVDVHLEERVLASARGLVTVSQPWADELERRYGLPVRAVYNGFEDRDGSAPILEDGDAETLIVAHLGRLYGGKRDPTPLFRALGQLGNDARHVRVDFYGPEQDIVRRLATAFGVHDYVRVHSDVPYARSLAVQSAADVLLLLMWNTPAEEGVLPGKLFEYLGARRPVLAVGAPKGAAATLIRDRRFGLASSDPSKIARQLRGWIAEKRARGRLAPLPAESTADFARSRQVRHLSEFLGEVYAGRGARRAGDRIQEESRWRPRVRYRD